MKKLYSILSGIVISAIALTPQAAAQAQPGYSMLKYSISPASGSTVDALETIVIDFPDPVDGIDTHIMNSSIGEYATLTCGDKVIKAVKLEAGTKEISKAYITFPKTTDAGTYTFSLAEGTLKDYEQAEMSEGDPYSVNPPITATYTIKGASLPETSMSKYTLDPADGSEVTSISKIVVAFPTTDNYDGIDVYSNSSEIVLEKDGVVVASTTKKDILSDYYSAQIDFDTPIKDPGTYTLKIPAGTFRDYSTEGDDVVTNYEITATYIIKGTSGIEDAVADDCITAAPVYDLYGRVVKSDSLRPGIYVVNGKKIAITK